MAVVDGEVGFCESINLSDLCLCFEQLCVQDFCLVWGVSFCVVLDPDEVCGVNEPFSDFCLPLFAGTSEGWVWDSTRPEVVHHAEGCEVPSYVCLLLVTVSGADG